ncbi:hypothetical protein ZYGR_0AD05960 [Zygosaccharomyces rouxii]|uniref:ZYRO0G19822p n=2 Tax=Zygosaccharomyces rouxii TaxID=4956 RepID=C5E1C2_ZYGRC|nr:uncharacterized protein ZYRO0G19822g [Zygosaccharomyces rouxii]KAH9202899.1 signal peptide peptidase-domain-containing protein [Zygosaccharomyces rouxii]GAV51413.1 hypothetical protein ZYGR_0AD05960 [Zygosaccharomyces rouxii]CAR29906.1 ZYRO0G19822p [Zygosaccharomyces rouxii]
MDHISPTQLEKVFNKIPKALSSSGLANYCSLWISKVPPSYVLVTIATTLVILGSLASITSIPHNSLSPTEKDPLFDPSDLELEKEEPDLRLDEQDAIIIPVCCGFTLVALYYSDVLTKLLRYSFVLLNVTAGTFVYSFLLNTLIRLFGKWTGINPLRLNPRYRLTLSDNNSSPHPVSLFLPNLTYRDPLTDKSWTVEGAEEPTTVQSSTQLINTYIRLDVIPSLILSIALSQWSPLQPIVPMNCAIYAITQIQFKNLKTATLILSALLVYDVYFVFYTPFMINASQIDLPIKIQLPTGLMGLGDIVLPGIFISLCYKFDIYRWHLRNPNTEFHLNRHYWGTYASTALLSYILALLGCFVALDRYQVAQPALLYVVPSQLISILSLAWWKDGFEMWHFHYEEVIKTKKDQGPLTETAKLLQVEEEYVEEEDSDYVPLSEEEDDDDDNDDDNINDDQLEDEED